MEKICIVKRRKPVQETTLPPRTASESLDHSQLLSIELTPQQTEIIRNNSYFQHLYTEEKAPIFLNIHFSEGALPRMLRPAELCLMLQVSRHTLDRLVRTGQIKSYRIGRQRRFSSQDVMDYLSSGCGAAGLRSVNIEILGRPEREFESFSTR
jgi:excisionase family DNA binding protein